MWAVAAGGIDSVVAVRQCTVHVAISQRAPVMNTYCGSKAGQLHKNAVSTRRPPALS
jgi:hypothetical protein